MQKARILVLMVSIFMLALSVTGVFAQGTIVDVAAGDENFSTLVSLVQAAGLADVLAGEGPYTVFAPTNDAFAALPAPVVAYLTSEAGLPTLTQILTYHVVSGEVMSSAITESMMADTMEMTAVGGDMLGGQIDVQVTDAGITVDGANVVTADVDASNGVIHAIDRLLLPDITLPEVDLLTVEGDILTAGSSTVFPLSEAIAAKWEADGALVIPTIDSVGTGGGFERFCQSGESDISNASRAINQEEIDLCAALATPRIPVEFRVGTDALTVVVSAENDFAYDVTAAELALIFGTAVNWSDVRPEWPAEPILRFIPGTDSGTFDYFVETVFDEDTGPILAASNTQQSEDDNVLVQGVESSPYAVGFFGYAYYQEAADALRALSIDGVAPTAETAENNTYPISRPLFIYSDAGVIAAKPQIGTFVNYYLTNVNAVIDEVGYFPASDFALNLAKLNLLAATPAAM